MLRRTPLKKRKEGIRSTSDRSKALAKADKWFSLYIRLRDTKPWNFKYGRCISCGKLIPFGQGDCGHYNNRAHMSTRFSELNCNFQCRACNRFDEGNIQGYRRGLIKKIGLEKVEMLEAMKYQTNKLSVFDLNAIADYYKKEAKKLKDGIG